MKNIVFALSMLCVCAVCGVKFYLPKLIDVRVSEQVNEQLRIITADFQKKNDQLAEIVKNLEFRQQNFENLPSEHKVVSDFRIDFERWNCWCDLKNKLRYGEECSEELARFRKEFSDCSELLKMVDSLISDKNNELKDDTLINNLRKFARIHKVNESELEKIAGYVLLSSIRKAGTNG